MDDETLITLGMIKTLIEFSIQSELHTRYQANTYPVSNFFDLDLVRIQFMMNDIATKYDGKIEFKTHTKGLTGNSLKLSVKLETNPPDEGTGYHNTMMAVHNKNLAEIRQILEQSQLPETMIDTILKKLSDG